MLWLKAQILKRWDAERRAQAPLDVMEPVQRGGRTGGRHGPVRNVSCPSLMRVLAQLRG